MLSAMVTLLASTQHKRQRAGLDVISGLALSSDSAAKKLLTPQTLQHLQVRPMAVTSAVTAATSQPRLACCTTAAQSLACAASKSVDRKAVQVWELCLCSCSSCVWQWC